MPRDFNLDRRALAALVNGPAGQRVLTEAADQIRDRTPSAARAPRPAS
jgi:hypothetical protein